MSGPALNHVDLRESVGGGFAPLHEAAGPKAYAARLAAYIRDASTIRARTMCEYGRAPSIEAIKLMQAKARERSALVRLQAERNTPAEDEDPGFWGTPGLIRLAAERRAIQQRALLAQASARLDDAAAASTKRDVVTAREVISLTAQAHGLTLADLTGRSRKRAIVPVRHMAAWILLQRGRLSRAQIGRLLGGRDHSTVINSIEAFEAKASPEQRALAQRIVHWCAAKCEAGEDGEDAPEHVGEAS